MKHRIQFAAALLGAVLLSGCTGLERQQEAIALHEQRMAPTWVKEHVIIGKTTKAEVLDFYGQPSSRTVVAHGIPLPPEATKAMPDETWSYATFFRDLSTAHFWNAASYPTHTSVLMVGFRGDVVASVISSDSGDNVQP